MLARKAARQQARHTGGKIERIGKGFIVKKNIQEFMHEQERDDYVTAASLAAANEPDRKAWAAGCAALSAAEARAIEQFKGEVRLNRHGQPYGGKHPALLNLTGYLGIGGCYAPE